MAAMMIEDSFVAPVGEDALTQCEEVIKRLTIGELARINVVVAKQMVKLAGTAPVKAAKKGANQALQEFTAFTAHVHKHALANGWDEFEAANGTQKNAETNKEEKVLVMMSASIERGDSHVFKNGDKFTPKHARSLASKLRSTNDAIWTEWIASYKPEAAPAKKEAVQVVRMSTEAQAKLTTEKAEADAKAKQEKAQAALAKAMEKDMKQRALEQKRMEKQQAALKKLHDDAEAAAKKLEDAKAAVISGSKSSSPAPKNKKKVEEAVVVAAEVSPVAAVAPVAAAAAPKKKKMEKKVEVFECPEGEARPWTFEGQKYIRTSDNWVYEDNDSDDIGDWVGVFDVKANTINTAITEKEAEEDAEDANKIKKCKEQIRTTHKP